MPFLSILGGVSLYNLTKNLNSKKLIIIFILTILVLYNSVSYLENYAPVSKINFTLSLSKFIQKNSEPNETIYGSFEITPLIAMLSNRKITNNYIDTNEKTFLTGIYNTNQRTKNLNGKVRFVLMKVLINQNGKIIRMEKIIKPNFLFKNCTISKIYPIKKDYEDNAVILFDCKKSTNLSKS